MRLARQRREHADQAAGRGPRDPAVIRPHEIVRSAVGDDDDAGVVGFPRHPYSWTCTDGLFGPVPGEAIGRASRGASSDRSRDTSMSISSTTPAPWSRARGCASAHSSPEAATGTCPRHRGPDAGCRVTCLRVFDPALPAVRERRVRAFGDLDAWYSCFWDRADWAGSSYAACGRVDNDTRPALRSGRQAVALHWQLDGTRFASLLQMWPRWACTVST